MTKLIVVTVEFLVTPKGVAKVDILLNKPVSEARNRTFRCDLIHNNHCNEFGHTLLGCTSLT